MKKRDILISISMIICILLAILLITGCKREEIKQQKHVFSQFEEEKYLKTFDGKPVIEFLDLPAVQPGQTFTIYGHDFGEAEGSVLMMNKKAETVSWNNDTITAKIPENFTSSTLKVNTENGLSNGISIIVMKGNQYYISEDGDDASQGTKKDPWKTFARAMQDVKSGDIVYVGPGSYNLEVKNGEQGKPIIIKGFGGDEINYTRLSNAKNIVFSGLNLNGLEIHNSSGIYFSEISAKGLVISKSSDVNIIHSDFYENPLKIKEYSNNIKVAYSDFHNSTIGIDSDESSRNVIVHDCNAYDNKEAGFSLRSRNSAALSINATRSNKGIIIGESTKVINCISNDNEVGITLTAFTKSDIEIYNCLSANNKIGLDIKEKVKGNVFNTIFSENEIAIEDKNKAQVELDFNLFNDNKIAMLSDNKEYDDVKDCRPCGLFSKEGNPRFGKSFRLQAVSSAIDAGKAGPGLDFDHKPRKYGLTADIGPFEYSE